MPHAAARRHALCTCLSAVVLSGVAAADVRLPAIIGPNMVLQADRAVPLWGWADPGEEIAIVGDWPQARAASATAGPDGKWRTTLQTPEAGGPYTIRVEGKNAIELGNVLIGEVWLAAGQSNMEWPLTRTDNAAEAIAAADHPEIRLFLVKNAISPAPLEDCEGRWVVCSPETVADFSAVAYYFGRRLNDELDVPVGLVAADWGGTPAQAWTSAEALAAFPSYADGIELTRLLRDDPEALEREHQAALAAWQRRYADAQQLNWTAADFDASQWQTMDQPQNWSGPDLGDFDGTVWFRRTVDIPAAWAGRELTLELGPIDDQDQTFFRGVSVGETRGQNQWNQPRRYTVPANLVTPGPAVIAVSVLDTGGGGGMHGDPEQMFLAPSGHAGDDKLSLAGEWRYRKGLSAADIPPQPEKRTIRPNTPSSLFNGMIAPVHPYDIRGVIWYQGESNRVRAHEYRSLFPAMITDWRKQWGSNFPFYFVQIAPFTYQGDKGETAELREAQLMTMALPETGMVVTMDIGDPRDIHPTNKLDVGERLARWALAKTYGRDDVVYSGPLYSGFTVSGPQAIVRFDHAGGLHSPGGTLKGFEIAGADRLWRAAGAIIEGETVVLSAYGIDEPVAVRYGWDDDAEPNLFNAAGLPASPFRTDNWPRVTQPQD